MFDNYLLFLILILDASRLPFQFFDDDFFITSLHKQQAYTQARATAIPKQEGFWVRESRSRDASKRRQLEQRLS